MFPNLDAVIEAIDAAPRRAATLVDRGLRAHQGYDDDELIEVDLGEVDEVIRHALATAIGKAAASAVRERLNYALGRVELE